MTPEPAPRPTPNPRPANNAANPAANLTSNILDTALIFEGGGMRGSYTAAVVALLLRQELFFDYVAGISAGSSHTANYLARDATRARQSFVDFADDPKFGSWKTWIEGKGMFNSHYIYEETCLPGGPLPYDFDSFWANPARFKIGAFDIELGQTVYRGRDQILTKPELMSWVRASSTMPLVMPEVTIDGRAFVDGAIGSGGGIPLDIAEQDGFQRFFVVMTRPRDYVKPPTKAAAFFRHHYRHQPSVAEGLIKRAENYNRTRASLLELEAAGQALLFFPDRIDVANGTRSVPALLAAYQSGWDQSIRQLPNWLAFLRG
ncbi:MAG: patatin family protein [Propionibacteriaceae bacterium]|jgi:predicted patatin/cPLA2 family phospholipase|nr:patatin family protein [Propionibacteriaceae bacterium]